MCTLYRLKDAEGILNTANTPIPRAMFILNAVLAMITIETANLFSRLHCCAETFVPEAKVCTVGSTQVLK